MLKILLTYSLSESIIQTDSEKGGINSDAKNNLSKRETYKLPRNDSTKNNRHS